MYICLSLYNELNYDIDLCIVDKFLHHVRIHIYQYKLYKENSRILMQSMINKRLHN